MVFSNLNISQIVKSFLTRFDWRHNYCRSTALLSFINFQLFSQLTKFNEFLLDYSLKLLRLITLGVDFHEDLFVSIISLADPVSSTSFYFLFFYKMAFAVHNDFFGAFPIFEHNVAVPEV